MGPRTQDKPKCLLEVGGKALLDWQIEALRGAGIHEIGIVRGYRGECLEGREVCFFENSRWQETNILSSLLCAEEWCRSHTVIVSYSDIWYSMDTVLKLSETPGDVVLARNTDWKRLWERRFENPLSDAESFRVDAQGNLLEIGARVRDIAQIQGQYMGLLKFSPKGWEEILNFVSALPPPVVDRLDMTTFLNRFLIHGATIRTVPIHGRWFEIDHERDLSLYFG